MVIIELTNPGEDEWTPTIDNGAFTYEVNVPAGRSFKVYGDGVTVGTEHFTDLQHPVLAVRGVGITPQLSGASSLDMALNAHYLVGALLSIAFWRFASPFFIGKP